MISPDEVLLFAQAAFLEISLENGELVGTLGGNVVRTGKVSLKQ